MTEKHDAALRAVDELIEANKEMRRRLRANELVLRRAYKVLEQGNDIATTFEKVPSTEPRHAMAIALQDLVKARHQLRLAVFSAGLEEGMTIGELSRSWGFSRQLGARYAKEARGET